MAYCSQCPHCNRDDMVQPPKQPTGEETYNESLDAYRAIGRTIELHGEYLTTLQLFLSRLRQEREYWGRQVGRKLDELTAENVVP